MTDEQKIEEARKWIGKKVRRGPDWIYGDQDGGDGKEGIVLDISTGFSFSSGWVVVERGNGHINNYRVITHKDLVVVKEIVKEVNYVPKKVNKISRCVLCNSPGEDLIFKFYCSSPSCRNFHL